MNVGDKILCVKDYINSSGDYINTAGKYYHILTIHNYEGKETDIVIGVTCNYSGKNIFWIKYQYFNDIWDDMRKKNLVDDFFLHGKKLRKEKLNKILEISKK